MLIKDILYENTKTNYSILAENCSQFFAETQLPLLKLLPREYNNIHKTKVRQRKKTNILSDTFNQAFESEHSKIFQRAVFANGKSSFVEHLSESHEPFYVFPIDGYKYMYCKEVENSSEEYKKVFDVIFEQFGNDKGEAVTILSDLLKFTYEKQNLTEGIKAGAEIVIYNIPYYYAVRVQTSPNYDDIINSISSA